MVRICEISLREDEISHDTYEWKLNTSKDFSINSAYEVALPPGNQPVNITWERIWKIKVARYRTFLWQVYHDRIMSNEHRLRCGLVESPICTICKETSETTLHILRDCPAAKSIWAEFMPQNMLMEANGMNLHDWIRANIFGNFYKNLAKMDGM